MIDFIKDKNESKSQVFLQFFSKPILLKMNMDQQQMEFQQEEYQSTYSSSEVDTYRELLLTTSDDKLIDMISRLKNDNDRFAALLIQLKEYASKKKDSVHLKKLQTRVIHLISNLKQNDRYAQTDRQKNILWFFEKICCNEKIMSITQQTEEALAKILCDFTRFEDFSPLIKLSKNVYLNTKLKNVTFSFNECLNYLYHQNYEKLQSSQKSMKFAQTMKTLEEENKLIVKAEIISYSAHDYSRWKIQESEIQKIIGVLAEKPYENLFKTIIQKNLKAVKQLRSSILKSKIQIIDDKAELVFGAKCQLCNELKTKEFFELAAKKSDGSELIPEMDIDSVILHGDYLYTKWSSDVIISAKQKVTYQSTEQQINQGFLKILSFMKKIFEHRHKHVQLIGAQHKMIEQTSHDHVPKETIDYICHTLQFFVKFLSFNSLEINHRSHNLSELIPVTFLDELFVFFEDQLKKVQQISSEEEKEKKEKLQKKTQKNIVVETIDYVMTFAAHLFYRRDFQSITALTSKTSQILIRILLLIENFPIRWTVLRNYKLVIDRWGESVDQGSEDYKKLARKFLQAYFNDKITVYSKSSSTVFNPIFITRPYCKIFSTQFLKCIEIFQKQLDDMDAKAQSSIISKQMNSKMSKIILFMSARVRFQDANKIAEHLSHIYRKYAHIIPEIYLFRSWISQMNLSKVNQIQMTVKLAECLDLIKSLPEKIASLSAKKLLTPVCGLNEEQHSQVLKLLNLYKTCHCRALNSLQLKPKTEQFGSDVYQTLWEITKHHIDLQYILKKKIKEFETSNKEEYETIRDQNQLLLLNNNGSIYSTVDEIKSNLLSLVRYYVCNAEKILSAKDCSQIVGIAAAWTRQTVNLVNQDKQKVFHSLRSFYIVFGFKLPPGFQSHLMKKQILGAMRALNGGEQLDLNKNNQVSFNEVSSLYEQIKPVYDKLIRLLLEPEINQKSSKQDQQLYETCHQILQYIILPNTNILGPCKFNGKIEQKSTEDMVLGLFLDQAETIFKNFTVEEILKLQEQYSLSNMLEITKNKAIKISEQKNVRPNQAGMFTGMRPNHGRNQAIEELRQIHIPEDYIQIAFENIQVPDAQLALQWIQNNQERIETLIIEKALKESKQQSVMKPLSEPKLQLGKITPLKYPQFIELLEKSMKLLVKNFAKQLFSQNGKKIAKVLFIVLDAFKDEFKKKQYQNFAKKIFEQINNLNGKEQFNDKKYRLILRILNFIMKKEIQLFNDYYKEGICLKVLSFVSSFANGFTNENEKQKQRKSDLHQLLQIINKTLPEWKSPIKQVKPQLISYLNCLLDLIAFSNIGSRDVWQILYKISLLQNNELRQKIVNLFSNIVLSRQILEEQKQRAKEDDQKNEKYKKNLPIKSLHKALPTKTFMLPLVKILLEQDKYLLTANIELQIKGYIAEEHKHEYLAKNQTQQNERLPLEIDLKKFSTSFDKFVGCPEFDNIFKKLFTKKKSKKNTLFYDFVKHPLYESEFTDETTKQSFISIKYSVSIQQILKALISRPLKFNDSQRQMQQEALIELYKLLDYFKVLIPTALRTEWWSQKNNKKQNLLEWLICTSVASNEKKFQFLTFLSMNNHLLIDDSQSISDWVCNEYLLIFRRQISQFKSNLGKIKQNQQLQINKVDVFKEQSVDQARFKKILLNFMYLLPVNKFNSQCFLKTSQDPSIREVIQDLFINISPVAMPFIYTVLSEIIFILRKRQMLQLLKQKYELHCQQSNFQNQTSNLYRGQFLSMSLIYKVDPGKLGDKNHAVKSSKKRNIFSGSSGRIVVDEVDDDEDDEINLDQMEAQGDQYDSITNLLRMRFRQDESRNQRVEGMEESFLYPASSFLAQYQRAHQQPQVQAQSQPQVNQSPTQNNQAQNAIEKIEEEPKEEIKVEIENVQPISKFDYAKLLQQQAEKLAETLHIVEKLLPQPRSLQSKEIQEQKIVQHSQKMVSEQQEIKQSKTVSISAFSESLSNLVHQVSTNTSSILPPNSRFDPNTQIRPQFICRLILKDNIPKLAKFQKRFRSIITTICPNISSNIWENDYITTSASLGEPGRQGRQMPSARWLMSRLQRDDSRENRDEVIYHIERLINQRRQQTRQENPRPRTLNLTQAFQDLPEQPDPPKVEQKPKAQEEKKQPQGKVQIKPELSQVNKVQELPVQQKMVEQKVEQPKQEIQQSEPQKNQKNQQKMQEEKPIQPMEEKVEEKPEQSQNKMIPEQQQPVPLIQQPIIAEQHQIPSQQSEIQPPQQFINEPEQIGPYREILAMFGLAQTFLVDNGIDAESFDSLPEELQIDQITHYMNQAQNRLAINQLNQANQPQQQQNIPQQGGQNEAQQPGGNSVNEVLQENIALFASMDPQTRMQMLAEYPPEFLLQLPVQMRTEIEQYRQRQLSQFAEEEEEENHGGLREEHPNPVYRKKEQPKKDLKKDTKYPTPKELNFNPISQSLAEHLAQSIYLKIQRTRVLQGFRLLLQNYLTQQGAIATILGVLRLEDGIKSIQLEYKSEENHKKGEFKKENSSQHKGYWRCESTLLSNIQQINNIKENLLNLVLQTLNESVYKNQQFLLKKVPYKNYLHLAIEPLNELEADEDGFWPLFELLPYSLELCPKLTVEILKRVKQLPLRLIKNIVKAIRGDKLTPQIYKNLQFLSKNEDMKRFFMEQFPEERPLKLETFAKIIKYGFARVPYLKKLHEEALSFYSAEYNQFLNQIFGIYSVEDIKEIQSILVKYKHVHFQVIKYLYSQNRVLDKEPIGLIFKMPHLLDFETKKYLFRKHPKIRRASRYRLPIEISRTNILQESFNQIMSKTPKQLEGRLQITFMDEQGYDAGGLTREWLMCLSREIFNPNYGLFEPSSSGNTYQPNPKSYINPDHLQYFKFIGRFVGKALAENQLVDAYFTRAFYKMVLGQQIELSDLEQQDYSFYKSMLWLKQNAIEEGEYTFSYLYDNFGQRIVKDLIPGGRDINVNEQNKLQYIEKYCLAKMRDDFKVQLEKFLEGFHQIVPHECINFFEAKQLELLISGLPEINFDDLRNNVDYSGYSPTDQAIKWLWQILEEFTQEDLARLIQFITGTSKIPVDGFANIKGMNGPQRISIHKDPNNHQLPKAHTCFNQLDLPNYDTKQIMRQRIVTAITWGSEGFGFM